MIRESAKYIAGLTVICAALIGLQAAEAQAATAPKKAKKPAAAKTAKPKPAKTPAVTSAEPETAEPASNCLVPSILKLHAEAVKQLDKDVKKAGTDHVKAAAAYRDRIALAWEAMNLPYCGYGSKAGLADEIHSFKKSIQRARADFLAATKKKKV